MMMTSVAIAAAMLAAQPRTSFSREQRELALAENAVFWALAASSSQKHRDACRESRLACCTDKADLGLALIAAKESRDALASLVALARFQLDAGLSENYSCHVLAKGRRILPNLRRAVPPSLAARCADEWSAAIRSDPKVATEALMKAVCSPPEDIRARLRALAEAIELGRRCSPEDL